MFAVALPITLIVEKGATLKYTLTVLTGEPPAVLPLTGCEAQMLVCPEFGSSVVYEDFSTNNGMLVINDAAGTIAFNVPKAHTLAVEWERGVCALYLDWPSGETWTLGRGPAFVEVGTRNA